MFVALLIGNGKKKKKIYIYIYIIYTALLQQILSSYN